MNRKRFALFALLALFCILLPVCHEERGEQLAAKPVISFTPRWKLRSRSGRTTMAS